MSDKLQKKLVVPAMGKTRFGMLVVLAGSIMVCTVVMLFPGCDKPKQPAESTLGSSRTAAVGKTTIEPVEEAKIPDKAALDDMLAHMSPSESQEFVRLLAQEPGYESPGGEDPDNTGNGEILPKFFPLTEELKELIRQAEHALRMDLSDEEKLAALEELDGINHPDILEVINTALDEANAEVREAALDAIMDINDPKVIPTVVKALDDEDPELREYALDALMDVDDPSLNEAFLKALDDESLDVREAAADMMLFIESPNIIDSLAKSMLDPNEDIRDMALITLEDIPDRRSVDVLIQYGLLNDNETIREDALDSIEWITDMEFENYEDARRWWDANRSNFEFDD